ncbi:MAG: hypothetical protein V3V00_02475, partial [Saprospiraceae bacterium]
PSLTSLNHSCITSFLPSLPAFSYIIKSFLHYIIPSFLLPAFPYIIKSFLHYIIPAFLLPLHH